MQASRSKVAAPPQSGPSAGPTRCVHARRETCGPFGAPELQPTEGAALRHTATEAPVPASPETTPRPASARCGKTLSQPLRSPRRSGAGGRSAEPQKTEDPERLSQSPQVTQHCGLHATVHIKQWKSFVSDVAVVPAETRESGKLRWRWRG